MILRSLALVALIAGANPAFAQVGRVFPSEKQVVADRTTGRAITFLTDGRGDAKIYPTHPQWAQDGRHILFRSTVRAEGSQIFAVDEISGRITQLTSGPGVGAGSINVARLTNQIYYMRTDGDRTRLVELDLDPIMADATAGEVRKGGYERIVATMPDGHIEAGGFTLDADETAAYVGFDARRAPPRGAGQPVPQVPGGIRAIDLKTGAVRTVVETDFRMGHVQANPFVPGEILYCHETGGDAPQRMWIVNADGTGNRPVYKEGPLDWVTHEQFADKDHVIFNLMGHKRELRQVPTGILVVNLRDNSVEHLGQLAIDAFKRTALAGFADPNIPQDDSSTGGYWHNAVTYDGRFAAGDDFDGNLHLIDRKTGKRTLLTTGHWMRPDHLHPSFSADNARLLVQSGMLTDGKSLALALISVPEAATE